MALILIDPDQDLMLPLPVEPQVAGALLEQYSRGDQEKLDRLSRRLAQALGPVIEMYIDWDLRPPSQAQIHYAVAIARAQGIEVPADVFRQRRAMGKFLDQHAKQRK